MSHCYQSPKTDPTTIITPSFVKTRFCKTSYTKCLVFERWTSRCRPKSRQTKRHGNKHQQIHDASSKLSEKLFNMGTRNPSKFENNWKFGPQSILPCGPRCSKIVPGTPKTQKSRHQACQMTSLGTKMTRSAPKSAKGHPF